MKLYADAGYQGPKFQRALKKVLRRVKLEIVKRSDRTRLKGLSSCPSAGSWSAPLLGSDDAADWRRIGRTSTARRSPSCVSLPSASCCEGSAIPHDVSGQTLRRFCLARVTGL